MQGTQLIVQADHPHKDFFLCKGYTGTNVYECATNMYKYIRDVGVFLNKQRWLTMYLNTEEILCGIALIWIKEWDEMFVMREHGVHEAVNLGHRYQQCKFLRTSTYLYKRILC